MSKPLSTDRPPSAATSVSPRAQSLLNSALRTLEAEAGGISTLCAAMHEELGRAFVRAVDLIGRPWPADRHRDGQVRAVGRKIAATFASTGTPAFFVHPSEASHGDLGMITPDDVIMALSWSGETAELSHLIDYSRRFRIGLIAITAAGESTLGKAADVVLPCRQLARPARTILHPRHRH